MKAFEILVVDDQPEITTMIRRFLKIQGYSVDTANDPSIALKLYEEKLYKVVFTDVRMPGMSGLELLQRIKSRQPAAIVIVMTAHHDIGMVIGCLENGAHDFLVKPIKSMDLLTEILVEAQKKVTRWMEALRPVSYDCIEG